MDRIVRRTTFYVMFGWIVGLAMGNWLAPSPPAASLSVGWHAGLVLMGTPAAGLLIGGGLAVAAAMLSKLLSGSIDGNRTGYLAAALFAPILAYVAAQQALRIAASLQ